MKQPLQYVSQLVADELWKAVPRNLDRYLYGNFDDLAADSTWRLRLTTTYEPGPLAKLDPSDGAEFEIANSLGVWAALSDLTPALAREDRMWIRLSHVDCLDFARARWLKNAATMDEEKLIRTIQTHFFAGTLTRCRDDHAISRLWWNAKLASIALPEDIEGALHAILQRADTRLNLIERPWLFNRPALAKAIVKFLRTNEWVRSDASHFREFMKALNLLGAGIGYEVISADQTATFLEKAFHFAERSDVSAEQ